MFSNVFIDLNEKQKWAPGYSIAGLFRRGIISSRDHFVEGNIIAGHFVAGLFRRGSYRRVP
jgi:hypothetical protein